MRYILNGIDKGVGKVELFLIQFSVLAIAFIMTAQIVLRYLFNSPIYWAEEVCVILMINMTFFGLSSLVHCRALVAVHLLRNFVSAKVQKAISLLISLLIIVVMILLTYHAVSWVANPNTQFEIAETVGIPKWTLYAIMPTAMITMTYHYIIYTIDLALTDGGGRV